jgi:3-phosphoinositide dependent protein kinase-1
VIQKHWQTLTKRADRITLQLRAEDIVFASWVEARPLKRRASLLPSLSIAPTKGKPRLLLLTPDNILCVKRQNKGSRNVAVKMEYLLDSPEKAKEKESRFFLTGVETKGERDFVLITVSHIASLVV